MRLNVLSCLIIGVLVTGCARVSTNSTLAADGSFQRKVVYTVNPPTTGGIDDKPVDPESLFKLPKNGDGIKVDTKKDAKGTQTITVERSIAAGAGALQDITLLSDKKAPMATSSVTVNKLADGRLEYVETLHWAGVRKPDTKNQGEQLRAAVKKALPEKYQKTELIDAATHKALIAAVHVLFGPAEPVFGDILINHDGAERRITRLLFEAYATALHESIPDMTPAECQAVAKTVVQTFGMDQMNPDMTPPDPSKPTENSSGNEMTPLYFEVGFPGTVAETNGITDPVTGHVYWSLFPAAIEVEDVTLRLVVQP